MRINLNWVDCPENMLDIIPETDEDNSIILEFLSNFAKDQDLARITVEGFLDGDTLVGLSIGVG